MNKRSLVFVAHVIVLLAGCTTNPDGSKSLGAPGTTDWILTTSDDQIIAHYKNVCSDYGFKPETAQFNQCVATESRSAKQRASDEFAAGLNSAIVTTPVPQTTTCTTVGITTNCTTY